MTCNSDTQKQGILWEMVNKCNFMFTFYQMTKFQTVQIEAFQDDKISMTLKLKSAFEWIKKKHCWLSAFATFPQCFQKAYP